MENDLLPLYMFKECVFFPEFFISLLNLRIFYGFPKYSTEL